MASELLLFFVDKGQSVVFEGKVLGQSVWFGVVCLRGQLRSVWLGIVVIQGKFSMWLGVVFFVCVGKGQSVVFELGQVSVNVARELFVFVGNLGQCC